MECLSSEAAMAASLVAFYAEAPAPWRLLDKYGFRQITWIVDIRAALDCDVVGKKLEWNDFAEGGEGLARGLYGDGVCGKVPDGSVADVAAEGGGERCRLLVDLPQHPVRVALRAICHRPDVPNPWSQRDARSRDERFRNHRLVDEVADVGEDAVVEVHAKEFGVRGGVEISFEALENGAGEVGRLMQHAQQRGAIGGVGVITREATCGADGERNRNGSCAGAVRSGGLGDEVDSHTENIASGIWGPQWLGWVFLMERKGLLYDPKGMALSPLYPRGATKG